MRLADFDYDLPPELIAQTPLAARDTSRLLEVRGQHLQHRAFGELPECLHPGDLLVFNDTKVIPARLLGTKPTGGAVEILLVKPLGGPRFEAMARGKLRAGTRVSIAADFSVHIDEVMGGGFHRVTLDAPDVFVALDKYGHLPLPPYIRREDNAQDRHVYQTMFATHAGSAAAPTAGLHFTPALIERLHARGVATAGVTLHVGPGTFLPVREEAEDDITKHTMHSEWYRVSPECAAAVARAKRVIAVGTTALRTLESVALARGRVEACEGDTHLYVTPGFEFRVVQGMVTNFHLPRSTLLILVSAFAGFDTIRAAYAEAIAQRYRFFSYGDAMLLWPATAHSA